MGCINSKSVARSCDSPIHDSPIIIRDHAGSSSSSSSSLTLRKHTKHHHNHSFEPLEKIKEETEDDKTSREDEGSVADRENGRKNIGVSNRGGELHSNDKHSKRFGFSIRFGKATEVEQVAAGWPAWLSAVAGEAIDGWLPLKSENFERLEKIGQGTYSNVYRARDLKSGKMVALKKVRFDNFQPESVRFMAREITILRRLDHPNVMKLQGIITSKLSCSIYLVFEYMEHDLAGLLSCPDIKFSDSQIKCYMWQLLSGIEHCHSRGVLHRDIKSSNILVNNEGVLKIADFGLANLYNSNYNKHRQPLTNRVVTLWYRPPELLLGSTSYGPYVDMWSVGCVFAELFVGRPILKGRTEVEQLHKIFKLCGTPADEYWSKSKLPLAAMFKPQHTYESCLREKCKELPRPAIDLIQTFLSVEPEKRGTAKSALEAEYFHTKPYACDPQSLPKYPPNKEIDAKFREEIRRRKAGGRGGRASGRNARRVHKGLQEQNERRTYRSRESVDSKASYDTLSEVSQSTDASSQADSICTLPAQPTATFIWATDKPTHAALRQNQSLDFSSDHQEFERFRHSGSMLNQSHIIDASQESHSRSRTRFYRDTDL